MRMEHNIIACCAEAINSKQGGEIFARHNAITDSPRGFVAGGMLRGFFKNNHMTCEQKICANDIPPSFVVDSNCDTTQIQFSLKDFYAVEKPFKLERRSD